MRFMKNSSRLDATIAMTHLILAAAEEGLGTCWVAAFDPAAAREVLGLPEDVVPWAFTPLGHPADSPAPKVRRPVSELVIDGRYKTIDLARFGFDRIRNNKPLFEKNVI